MLRTAPARRSYSARVCETTDTRVLPSALEGVLTLEEYQFVLLYAFTEHEAMRRRGLRLIKVVTRIPCVVLCLMPLLVRHLGRLEKELVAKLEARCVTATAAQGGRVQFCVRQQGSREGRRGDALQQSALWIDLSFQDLGAGHVRGDLYALQPPAHLSELAPSKQHELPAGLEESDDDEALLLT